MAYFGTRKEAERAIRWCSSHRRSAVNLRAPKADAPRAPRQNEGRDNNRDGRRDNRDGRDFRDNRNQNRQQSAAKPAQQPAAQAPKQPEPERKRERRVVDTSAVQVNSNRFADVDNLVSEKVQDYQGGKQRIGGGKGKQQKQQKGNFKGNKSRNEEQEKMRRLQMEVARKAPTVVKIPDEISSWR